MAVTRDKVLAAIVTGRIPPDLCWGKPSEFVKQLAEIFSAELDINENNDFVVIGHQTPSEDDKARLWIRLSRIGTFAGFYLFVDGSWQRIHNYRNDEIIWMEGDSREIPDGFELINDASSGIDSEVRDRLVSQYVVNGSAGVAATVYKYFAVRYVGL